MTTGTANPTRPGLPNRTLLRLLGSRLAPLLNGTLTALRYRPATAPEPITLPVQYACAGAEILVAAGTPDRKRWWRHFRHGAGAEVLLDGRWIAAEGRLLTGAERDAGAEAYRGRFPRLPLTADTPIVAFTAPPVPLLRGRRLAWTWFLVVTVAEFLGFAIPAVTGALTANSPTAVSLPALLLAGAVEGAALGTGQALVLRRILPAFNTRRWVAATAGAASFAYLAGLAPSTWAAGLVSWPPLVLWPVAAVLGTALLLSIGFAQWLVLRRHLARSARWIFTTAGAWLLGLAGFLGVTMPLWQPGQGLGPTILIGIAGGLVMAATTSAVTGVALRRLPGLR
ncbi:hypothetical protein [Amycolatopsis sp. MtRt-6]|uniref:hypothetical protein n=1 Tax=Amycolatopsis sp. MtRt-6 TaxID=2792782 RepID=UPI001A8FBA3E|nr:hypothetical protein [Amycolatopsis sp. MtRt-6]